jgi:hypothetical protein
MSAVLSAFAVVPSKSTTSLSGQAIKIGVELPLTGDAGADGLLVLRNLTDTFNTLQSDQHAPEVNLLLKDSAMGGYQDPHQDEGVDASVLPSKAAKIVGDFARDSGVMAVIGGLTPASAAADAAVARKNNLPLISIAPMPDKCSVIARRTNPKPGPVSVSGWTSMESLSVARVVEARGYREIGIMNDGTPARSAQATCFIKTLAMLERLPPPRITRPDLTSDFATLKQRAIAGTIDGFVYFGPPERGALVCGAAGALLLSEASLLAAAHRGYDSSTLPRQCTWVRRSVYEAYGVRLTGHDAAWGISAALSSAARRHGGDISKITRSDLMRALNEPQIRCIADQNGGSFSANPPRG